MATIKPGALKGVTFSPRFYFAIGREDAREIDFVVVTDADLWDHEGMLDESDLADGFVPDGFLDDTFGSGVYAMPGAAEAEGVREELTAMGMTEKPELVEAALSFLAGDGDRDE